MFTYLFIQDALHAFTLVFTFQTFADIVINSHECKITSPPFLLDELPLTGNFFHLKYWFFFYFQRLWCSWAVKGPTHSFYFGGDTGYNKIAFQQIGKKYGPFSLSALPIGAYEPRLSTFDKHDT